jgi:hypothetical protein
VPVPLVPTGAVSPELLIAPAIPMTTVVDETGRLSMSVPSTWTDTDGVPDFNDNGSDRPLVTAASDLNGFYTDWLVPGAVLTAFPFNDDPSALLRNLGFPDQCLDGGVQSFDNGVHRTDADLDQLRWHPNPQRPAGDQPGRSVGHRARRGTASGRRQRAVASSPVVGAAAVGQPFDEAATPLLSRSNREATPGIEPG